MKNDGLFVPEIDLREGLQKTYEWYCNEIPRFQDSGMTKIDLVLGLK